MISSQLLHRPGEGNSGGQTPSSLLDRWMEGDWRRADMPANQTDLVISRASAQAQAVQLSRACTLVGWTCSTSNLGGVDAAAGGALTIKAIRVSAAGVADAAVTIGTVNIGESNVSKVANTEIVFAAGDSVYLTFSTPAGWTSTTIDPTVRLEFEEIA